MVFWDLLIFLKVSNICFSFFGKIIERIRSFTGLGRFILCEWVFFRMVFKVGKVMLMVWDVFGGRFYSFFLGILMIFKMFFVELFMFMEKLKFFCVVLWLMWNFFVWMKSLFMMFLDLLWMWSCLVKKFIDCNKFELVFL